MCGLVTKIDDGEFFGGDVIKYLNFYFIVFNVIINACN